MERHFCWCTTGIKYLAHFYLICILTTYLFFFHISAFLGNYADSTTLYSIQINRKSNQTILNYNFTTLQKWFYENDLKSK